MKAHLPKSLRGLSGDLDGWVYQYRNGKTYIRPKWDSKKGPSQAMLNQQERFEEASDYANEAKQDPALCEFYGPIAEEKGLSIYTVAMADFLNEPTIEPLKLAKYQGNVGDKIVIRAVDDLGFADLNVKILAQDGTLIESGKPVQSGPRSKKWTYIATQPVAKGTDIFIEVEGCDHAGTMAKLTENPTVGAGA